jgi:hypothetical protein
VSKAAATLVAPTNCLVSVSQVTNSSTAGATNCFQSWTYATNALVGTPAVYGFASTTAGVATNAAVVGIPELSPVSTLFSNLVNTVNAVLTNLYVYPKH